MKTKHGEISGMHWNPGVVAALFSAFLMSHQPSYAGDALPLLDAPGPGYREQKARAVDTAVPANLQTIGIVHTIIGPESLFDGEAPDQPFFLPRGDLKVLSENPEWNFRVYEDPTVEASRVLQVPNQHDPLRADGPTFHDLLPSGVGALPAPVEAVEEEDVVRLPVLPEVMLPLLKEIGDEENPIQPFIAPRPLGLRLE